MKPIKDILRNKNVPNLVNICRMYGLRGYTALRKEGIVDLIAENIKKSQFQENIKYSIPENETVGLILKLFLDNKNEITYANLRENMLKVRSAATFRDNYRTLLTNCFIFEDEDSEDNILYLPKEFSKIAEVIVQEKIKDLSPEIEVENAEQETEEKLDLKEITTIDQLLISKKYTNIIDLQRELMARNLKLSGTKKQLVERLLYESNEDIKDLLGLMLGKVELKNICEDFELPVSGTKEELLTRILNRLPFGYPDKLKIETKHEEEIEAVSSGLVEEIIQEVSNKSLKESLYEALNDLTIETNVISKAKDGTNQNLILTGQIFIFIRSLSILKSEFKDVKINHDEKENLITIEKEKEKIAIFTWVFQQKQKPNIAWKIMNYRKKYSEDLILYIYDSTTKLSPDDLDTFQGNAQIIHKTAREFRDRNE